MISGLTAPKFGAITLHGAEHSEAIGYAKKRASFDVTLTDDDTRLRPLPDIPDHFRVVYDEHGAKDPVRVGWKTSNKPYSGYNQWKTVEPEDLKPLITEMSVRNSKPDEKVAESIINAQGLNSDSYSKEEIRANLAPFTYEMARYPNLEYPVGKSVNKDFFPQHFRGLSDALNTFREFVGLKPNTLSEEESPPPTGRLTRFLSRIAGKMESLNTH